MACGSIPLPTATTLIVQSFTVQSRLINVRLNYQGCRRAKGETMPHSNPVLEFEKVRMARQRINELIKELKLAKTLSDPVEVGKEVDRISDEFRTLQVILKKHGELKLV